MPKALIHVVDDDELVRASAADLLADAGYEVSSHASGNMFLMRADLSAPGIVILDLRMPGLSGLDVLARLAELGSPLRTVMLSGAGQVPDAVAALKTGAYNYLEKPYRAADLLQAVDAAVASLEEAEAIAAGSGGDPLAPLTPRQREVIEALAAGATNREAGKALGLSTRTVEMHRSDAMKRLGVESFAEALQLVFRAGKVRKPGAS